MFLRIPTGQSLNRTRGGEFYFQVSALALSAVLLLSGCATKGFVRDELEALRMEMDAKDSELASTLEEVRNSATQAMARAEIAAGESGHARELALGRVGYRIADTYAVTFGYNSVELGTDAEGILAEVTARIRNHPEYLVDIYGFTDSAGSSSYNLTLGQRRAEAVLRQLIAEAPGELHRCAAVSFGEANPSADASQSRRVEVNLVLRVDPTDDTTRPAESLES
jgi:peptidoglycan-associated lipoprotein